MVKGLLKRDLRNLCSWQYKIVNKSAPQVKVVENPLPIHAGMDNYHQFPKYLKGYEEYYEKVNWYWKLKTEYIFHRPKYTITIIYYFYDIELTDKGRKRIEKRYNFHKRLSDEYAKILEKI